MAKNAKSHADDAERQALDAAKSAMDAEEREETEGDEQEVLVRRKKPSATPRASQPVRSAREMLEDLRQKERALLRQVALEEHPKLAEPVAEVEALAKTVHKCTQALAAGPDKPMQKQRAALERKVEKAKEAVAKCEAKLASAQADLTAISTELDGLEACWRNQIHTEMHAAQQSLQTALKTHHTAFEKTGLSQEDLIPALQDCAAAMDEGDTATQTAA